MNIDDRWLATKTPQGARITAGFVRGYAIGYFYGRQVGDAEPGREEMDARFGPNVVTTVDLYAGFKSGYADGVDDHVADLRGPED